mmetsp:Transcript_81903/g.227048  ORF Transcript_81903/g.227048 Transcript_81903/m.227048 type:complete len:321 (-) Transcript_81903:209-1171(-)
MELASSMSWKLTNKAGQQVPNSELGGKVIALYFSAHWCPPCRGFTPVLKKFYETVNGGGGNLQIVFVSSDKSEAEGKDYFINHHGDWLMLDFGQKGSLGEKYGVRGIPSLIVIDSAGMPIADDARGQVAGAADGGADGMKAVLAEWAKHCTDWRQTAGSSLGGSYVAGNQEAMRAARLARLAGGPPPPVQAAPAPAPAPMPASVVPAATVAAPPLAADVAPAPAAAVDADEVARLAAMGFSADQARQALASGGDFQTAAAMLTAAEGPSEGPQAPVAGRGGDDEAVGALTAMGFDAAQARHALEAAGGSVEAASAILLGD